MRKITIKLFSMILLITSLLFISLTFLVSGATPEGPSNIAIINSTSREPQASSTLDALAGNVTQLNIIGTTVTQTWQGYYGNISGTITLDDALNNTLYDWSLASPEGEIYAATAPVDFSSGNVLCFNYSPFVPLAYTSLTELETSLGLQEYDADGVNETFSDDLTHTSFFASLNYIDGSTADKACPTVRLYNSSEESTEGLFEEVLLYDKTSHATIYTGLIENNQIGFTNKPMDFQMLVGENGHSGDTQPTTYYFYVELE